MAKHDTLEQHFSLSSILERFLVAYIPVSVSHIHLEPTKLWNYQNSPLKISFCYVVAYVFMQEGHIPFFQKTKTSENPFAEDFLFLLNNLCAISLWNTISVLLCLLYMLQAQVLFFF